MLERFEVDVSGPLKKLKKMMNCNMPRCIGDGSCMIHDSLH
jgi:hypothetical protein